MSKIDDGGAAFPLHPGILPDWDQSNGMSLRDWFAGQAIIGLTIMSQDRAASLAYKIADAMLDARSKGEA